MCVRQKGVSLGFFWGWGGAKKLSLPPLRLEIFISIVFFLGGGLLHNLIMGSSSDWCSDWTQNGFKPCLRECLLWLNLDFGFSSARASAPSTPIIFEALRLLRPLGIFLPFLPPGADNINL